ncbi:MAG: GIY-YIG nuclease family protein [Fimbriiglobus sp.]|jgi:excinuclease ABC subunit C|nr:GIY-YIG nuclease family protein [Fimbriiglobus sp.]
MPRGKDQPTLPGLSDGDQFAGFGASAFRAPTDTPSGFAVRTRSAAKLREAVRANAPRTPGVYGMLGPKGHVVYVGKAKNLRSRLLSYFREDSRHPKAGKIIDHTATLVWEHLPDELNALLRELELIRRFRPRFNVLGQPGRQRYVYLCLGRGPAVQAYLSREATGKELGVYGPFVGRGRLADAVRRLNYEFKLRDCPNTVGMRFADQTELFTDDRSAKCLRYELGTCLGPCGGFCTTGEYAAKVRAAKAFLDGRDGCTLKAIQAEIAAAAAELRFEQAAALRDRWEALSRLNDRLMFLRTARANHSFVYPLAGCDNLTRWYLIHGGEVRAVVREPDTPELAAAARATIDGIYPQPHSVEATLRRCVDSVLIVTSWFRTNAGEKAKLLTAKEAVTRCHREG